MTEAHPKRVGFGILMGISTGVFWGLPFLVPQVLNRFTSFEIAFGRFFFFGMISFLFLKPVISIIQRLSWVDRLKMVGLSVVGFWGYSIILFYGVQHTDGIISSLIIGLLPITIPLFTRGRRHSGLSFFLGLFLLLTALINLFLYPVLNGTMEVKAPSPTGVTALLLGLASWTIYPIANTRFLQHHTWIPRKDWSSVMGVVSILCFLPIFALQSDVVELIHRQDFSLFLICSLALGFGSSWFANWLWNICSYHCPSEISGPLLVFEALFCLIYSYFYEQRAPRLHESVSILLYLVGVLVTIRSQMKKRKS